MRRLPTPSPRRRALLCGLLAAPLVRAAEPIRAVFEPWQPGRLDIHHIATGQGNSTLVLFPDGTSLLIDAGATASVGDVVAPPKPGSQRRAGEWIGRYVQRHLRAAGLSQIDYALVTHLHPDHVGDVDAGSPMSIDGTHRLTGITDVAALVPIAVLVDRGFPDYAYPIVERAGFAQNYRAFVESRVRNRQAVRRFEVGSAEQFAPVGRVPATAANFGVRNIAANGTVWTGQGTTTKALFPALDTLPVRLFPTENMCSTAIRIDSGNFSYFTAGDLTSDTLFGERPWRDVLSPAARVAGPVDVATADHHGLFDSLSADVARALRPRAWIVQAWHASHPSLQVLDIMLSEELYPGARDIFATSIAHASYLANARLLNRLRSQSGHVVVRVEPGGNSFSVVVTDNDDERDSIKSVLGPLAAASRSARR